jgi:hypothetical protein
VRLAQQLGIRYGEPLQLGGELLREGLECGQLLAKLELRPVKEYGQDRLRRACVADHLLRKKEVLLVVGRHRTVVLLLPPFEQEHETMHLAKAGHTVGIKGVELLHLDAGHAKL